MKTVIYLDVLLLVNFLIGYFLLQAAGLLCGGRPGFRRSVLAAGVAASATLVLLLPPLPIFWQAMFQAVSAAAVVRCAFAWQGIAGFVRRVVWYFALNLCLAGTVILLAQRGFAPATVQTNNLAVYLQISPGLLLACSLGVFGVLRLILLLPGSRSPQKKQQILLECGTKTVSLTAICDTGFSVREPVCGSPVLLVSLPAAAEALPRPMADYLTLWFGASAAMRAGLPLPPGRFYLRLVPMHTAAGTALAPAFLLPVIIPAAAGQKEKRLPGVPVAFCNEIFSSREFAALFGPAFLRELT